MSPARTVFITGASTGIGRASALHMDRLGWRVFAGVRTGEDARSLEQAASASLSAVFVDLTEPASVREAAAQVTEAVGNNGLAGLVNNAGIGLGGPVEFLDLDEVRTCFEVNVFGGLALTQACLTALRAAKGHIVNVSSVSGLVAVPFLGPYAASKFALEAFSDSLRVELRPWGIPVSVIQMGAIHTPIWDKGLIYLENTIARHPERFLSLYGPVVNEIMRRVQPHGVTPAKVAQVVARALTAARPRPRYRMGWGAGLFVLLRLLPDRSRDWLISTQLPGWG